MSVHLQREIDRLKQHLLSVCTIAEAQVEAAVRAVLTRDVELARRVEQDDREVDSQEVEVEEECLKVLALYQPVALDLRLIISALKINNDLERIADMAVNIARKGASLAALPPVDVPFDLAGMWQKTQSMLHDSIQSLVDMNSQLASSVCARDDEVDGMKREFRVKSLEQMRKTPDLVEVYLNLMAVVRNLERTADLATNIAEDVIYMTEARIIRHGAGR